MSNPLDVPQKIATESDLSSFVGADVRAPPKPAPAHRSLVDTVESDHVDWTDRLFNITEQAGFPEGVAVSPTVSPSRFIYQLQQLFVDNSVLLAVQHRYFAYVYDSISVRITLSEPKNLVGGIFAGWWPYQDWFDKNVQETFDAYTSSADTINYQTWINSPYTHFVPFGMAQECAFTIPWSYKTPMLETRANTFIGDVPERRPLYGTPSVWFAIADQSAFVNSITNSARAMVFIKFSGLRFFGPGDFTHEDLLLQRKLLPRKKRSLRANSKHGGRFEDQSGLEVAALAEVASVTASALGVDMVAQNAMNMFSSQQDLDEISRFGTFDDPQAVQMAYVGDTISCDFPQTTPIFSPHLNMARTPTPSVHEMLSRPQFLRAWNSETDTYALINDPLRFSTAEPFLGNYFRWFGMLNRYWRGTINFIFLIASHPLVQCRFKTEVSYPLDTTGAASTSRSAVLDTHVSVFNGSKQITVPVPYCTSKDYMACQDSYPYDAAPQNSFTTVITAKLTVISTMLDTEPVIPYYIFVQAAPDFAYYSPLPPGLYNSELNDAILAKMKRKETKKASLSPVAEPPVKQERKFAGVDKSGKVFFDQVYLPLGVDQEVMRSRYAMSVDPGTLVSLPNLIDYMKIWCRCTPFVDYNNLTEEPILDLSPGLVYPYWYPPIDRTEDENVNNSWYFTLDYIALLSTLFLYFRGELAFKVLINTTSDSGYYYVSLGDPVARQRTHVPFLYSDSQVPPDSNFGAGTVITPSELQPVLEVSIPYRGSNVWSYANANAEIRPPAIALGLVPNAKVNHNIPILENDDTLTNAVFRKVGPNFNLAVETVLPPATMWAARGFDWSS